MSEAKLKARIEAMSQNFKSSYFDAKLRFTLFASLRSAILSEIDVDNKLVTLPAGLYILKLQKIKKKIQKFLEI
jgi:hypothetical protein